VNKTKTISRGRLNGLVRTAGTGLLNLWISSMIPPALMTTLRSWTLLVLHQVVAGVFVFLMDSSCLRPNAAETLRIALTPPVTAIDSDETRVRRNVRAMGENSGDLQFEP